MERQRRRDEEHHLRARIAPMGSRQIASGRTEEDARNQEGGAMAGKKWSQDVTEHSDALDLEEGVFTHDDPKEVAKSLKRSAEKSHRRKSDPYRSAMSMLTFYINRAGKDLGKHRKRVLEDAKDELRKEFGREPENT
jgi:hypothetical protein